MSQIIQQISKDLSIPTGKIEAVLKLLDEGNTIPFIARYRKEATGSLDEVQINDIQSNWQRQTNLLERKEEVIRLINEQDKLTPELEESINQADSLQRVEDLYRPYRQRRRTLAQQAREQGLEPLSDWLLSSEEGDINDYASQFINEEVTSVEEALKGAGEILSEVVGDEPVYREFIRKYTRYNGQIETKLKDEDLDPQKTYQIYYEYAEPINKIANHRVLAINRAEKEEVITVKVIVDEDPVINYLNQRFIPEGLPQNKLDLVQEAVKDGYRRFIAPSIEREMRNDLTQKAEESAIDVFGENLRNLLLQPPLKGKTVLGFDPAYRTGCKLAVMDPTGRVLDICVIYPHKPANQAKRDQAYTSLLDIINKYQVDIIAIGNGTASRESEQFVSDVIKDNNLDTQFMVVDEAGASVYSASKEAREEFPNLQVEERSAVSIGRRIQDPLAELIKIDPKSLGVGQYQHDVSQKALEEELDFVVNITVNQVGVDINTASPQLLQHVSGLTKATANNVIEKRNELGKFTNRDQIKDVKRLGPKTYEQAAGFLRIIGGDNPLDQTSIHPESYPVANNLLEKLGYTSDDLGTSDLSQALDQLDLEEVSQELEVGVETLVDIVHGLKNPTADVRDGRKAPTLRSDVLTMEDLEIGMRLEGVVRNVVDFGAFVDIGVKEDGLVHISQLSNNYVKHPGDIVSVGDVINVEVIQLELSQNRIGLRRIEG